MKRILICAAAAIVALASCSKTQVVYNDAPEEIGFKAVTGVMTKAENPLGTGIRMGVFAETGSGSYFTNALFTHDSEGVWTGGKYWPVTGELTFTLYAPYDGTENTPGSVNYNSNNLTITADNSNIDSQTDWIYGATQPTGTKSTSGESMGVNLKHALSKVVVTVDGDSNVKLQKVEILQTAQKATGTVNYTSNNAGAPTWVNAIDAIDAIIPAITLFDNLEGETLSSTDVEGIKPCLVIPTANLSDQAIRLTYKLTGGSPLTYTTTVASADPVVPNQLGTVWAAGTQYTYNITIGAKEIKFTPTETTWVEAPQTIEVTPNN